MWISGTLLHFLISCTPRMLQFGGNSNFRLFRHRESQHPLENAAEAGDSSETTAAENDASPVNQKSDLAMTINNNNSWSPSS